MSTTSPRHERPARLRRWNAKRSFGVTTLLLTCTLAAACGSSGANKATSSPTKTSATAVATVPGFWTRCSLDMKVASVEVSPVEVLHLTCAQAKHAIQRASNPLTPAGPIFSTPGYTCTSTNILPRFDPSPVELPAAETCNGTKHHQFSFIWNYAS